MNEPIKDARVMRESARAPEVRVRVKHTQTAKGWRCDETTVEVTRPVDVSGPEEAEFYRTLMQSMLHEAHQDGLQEANRRNLQEGRDL